MDKQQLVALINAKIIGQGNQIDLGGALAEILLALAASAMLVEVDDITALTDDQVDALNVGDKVAAKGEAAKTLYVVSYKNADAENGVLELTYTDAREVVTVSYTHSESGWAYDATIATTIRDE